MTPRSTRVGGGGVGDELCAVVLAAGEGRRLRPLTMSRPKALCPVGNIPLLDRALSTVAELGFTGPESVAVNACWLGDQVVSHVDGRTAVSLEPGTPLGTAGGLGRLRDWIDGRGVLVGNADAYLSGPGLTPLLSGWDGTRVRLLGIPAGVDGLDRGGGAGEFGAHQFAGFSLLPWSWVAGLRPEPADLVREVWRPAERAGQLDVIEYPGRYIDTGTPNRYLAANLHAAAIGGVDGSLVDPSAIITGQLVDSVVGSGATVAGRLTRSVLWPGGRVESGEHLSDSIRGDDGLTVPIR